MSARIVITSVVIGLPIAAAMALYFLGTTAETTLDGRRLFLLGTLSLTLAGVWGPVRWLFHTTHNERERTAMRLDMHDDELADLRYKLRQLATDNEALSQALAYRNTEPWAVGLQEPTVAPSRHLYVVQPETN